jgi:hypothetical protein
MPEAFSVMTTWESLGALVYRGDLHSWFLQGLAVGRVRPYGSIWPTANRCERHNLCT